MRYSTKGMNQVAKRCLLVPKWYSRSVGIVRLTELGKSAVYNNSLKHIRNGTRIEYARVSGRPNKLRESELRTL